MRKKSALAGYRAVWRLLAGLCLGFAVLSWAAPGMAQGTVVIGGSGRPEVEVNLGALNQLGPEPGYGGRLLLPPSGPQTGGPIRLHPPGSNKARTTRRSASGSSLHLKPPGGQPAAKPKRTAKATPAKATPAAEPKAPPVIAAEKPMPSTPPASEAPPVKPEVPSKAAAAEPVPPPAAPPATAPLPSSESPAKPQSPGISAGGALGPMGSAPLPPPPPAAAVEKPPQRDVAVVPALPSTSAAVPAAPKAPQVAALPPTPSQPAASNGELVVRFQRGDANLSRDAEQQLSSLAGALSHNDARLQLKAYAGNASDPSSGARRMSLSRALAVRSYLIDKGIRSTRIDVRALGAAADSGPPDRVDVLVQGQ